MTILLCTTPTARAYGRNQQWFCCDNQKTERFDTVADALAAVKKRYGNAKRSPMYSDTKSRGTIQTGWVISGKNDDGYTQDWVSLSRVLSETNRVCESVDIKKEARL